MTRTPIRVFCLSLKRGGRHLARQKGLEVTRSRAYCKNDQAWVDRAILLLVRPLVGYGRLGGLGLAQALARLYAAARLHTNLFQPSRR
jgi:hypothetical protein